MREPTHIFGETPGKHLKNMFSYRTLDEKQWRYVVDILFRLSPIVVIDARATSPYLLEEAIQALKEPAIIPKVSFVVGENGEQPVIDSALSAIQLQGICPPETLSCLTVKELIKSLVSLTHRFPIKQIASIRSGLVGISSETQE